MDVSTVHAGWKVLRALYTGTGAAPESALAVTARLKANVPSHAFTIPDEWNRVEIMWGANAHSKTVVCTVYLQRHDGEIVLACVTGNMTSGTQVLASAEVAADTLTVASQNWLTTIAAVDGGAANRMARLYLDVCGYDKIFVLYTTVTHTSNWTAYISGF